MKKIILAAAALIAATPACAQMARDPMEAFANADANGDGVITRAEFVASRAKRFDKLDRNHDGAVSKDDFKRLARFRPQASERIGALIEAGDANNDGRLTRAEMEASPPVMFERADANGDGKVDAAELAAAKSRLQSRKQQR